MVCGSGFATAGRGEIELVFDHDNRPADNIPYPPRYAEFRWPTAHQTITEYERPRLIAFT